MKQLKSMNICFGFLLSGTGKCSWGHLHFSFTATTEDSPFFLSLGIYVSSTESLCGFADVVPGHTILGLTTCAPRVQ